jgi:hypothetical protein
MIDDFKSNQSRWGTYNMRTVPPARFMVTLFATDETALRIPIRGLTVVARLAGYVVARAVGGSAGEKRWDSILE